MGRPKKIQKETKEEVSTVETQEIEQPTERVSESEESIEKKNFRALIELYKKQNPQKYALKEIKLIKQLNTLK